MRVILRIVEGPAAGRRFTLAAGQIAQVGRTEWADFAIPADPQLADVHFSIEAAPSGCRVRTKGDAELLVNGRPAEDTLLRDGDRISAGRSAFAIGVEGVLAGSAASLGGEERDSQDGASQEQRSAGAVAARLSLSPPAKALLQEDAPCRDYATALLDAGLSQDAVRVAAGMLEKSDAVRWAVACVRRALGDSASPKEAAALDAAHEWAQEPTEENRRAAEAAAISLNYDGPAAFAALAAFWSGDNLAPVGLPAAPTPAHLYLQGVCGAVLLAAPLLGPETIDPTLHEFARAAVSGEF